MQTRVSLAALLLVAAPVVLAAQSKLIPEPDPVPPESVLTDGYLREAVTALNRLRAEPASFIPALERLLPRFSGLAMRTQDYGVVRTREGAAAVRDAISFLRTALPAPPVTLSAGLTRAAEDHVRDIASARGRPRSWTGSDVSSPADRARRHGLLTGDAASPVAHDPPLSVEGGVLLGILVDDGVADRAGRNALLDPRFRWVGTASQSRDEPGSEYVFALAEEYRDGVPPDSLLLPDYLTALEADVWREWDLLRFNPPAYARFIEERLPRITDVREQAAAREAIADLRSRHTLGPLRVSPGLTAAARLVVAWIGPLGLKGHYFVEERDNAYGTVRMEPGSSASESIYYGRRNARDMIVSLLIDYPWVYEHGGEAEHRENILAEKSRLAGVGCGPHLRYGMHCVLDSATRYFEADGALAAARAGLGVVWPGTNSPRVPTAPSDAEMVRLYGGH